MNRRRKKEKSGPESHAKTPRRVFDDMMMVLRDRRTFVIVPSSRADDRFQFFECLLFYSEGGWAVNQWQNNSYNHGPGKRQ